MSDTTGWKRSKDGCYTKRIDGNLYGIFPFMGNGYRLRGPGELSSSHEFLESAQRGAHQHARDTK